MGSTTLDGKKLFDEQQLEIEQESLRRDSIERAVSGLDGVISIDLGSRSRVVRQRGVLRAKSRAEMEERINTISACIDGKGHELVTSSGEKKENLRMDVFEIIKEQPYGSGVCCEYKIVYTQLVA